jgi:hypothetical protein
MAWRLGLVIVRLFLVVAFGAACGNRSECDDTRSCRANPTVEAREATTHALLASPTGIAPTPAPAGTQPPVTYASPTSEPPTPPPAQSTAIPPATPTLMPPDPSLIATPRPTDAPFTPRRRPQLPAAGDIHVGGDGKYVADVDGCHWEETGRLFDGTSGGLILINLRTPCEGSDEGIHFYPETGEVRPWIA